MQIIENRGIATKKLKSLANSFSNVDDMVFGFSIYGSKPIKVPKDIEYEVSKITIYGKSVELYDEFIEFLKSQTRLEYMRNNKEGREFVENELNKFVYDVFYKKYNHQELNTRIKEILGTIYKPIEAYKVIIPLNFFYTRIPQVFEIGDSLIEKLDLDRIRKDALSSNSGYESFFDRLIEFEGNYCITIYEEGNNLDLVIERARKKASKCLNRLKLYLFKMNYKDYVARSFAISYSAFVYKESSNRFISLYFGHNKETPYTKILDEDCVNNIKYSLSELDKFDLILNNDTRKRIERSIHWFGKAITETDSDVCLVLYCTGLEALLIPEVGGKKGQILALRASLIQKKMLNEVLNPFLLFNIYEIRSDVIHGSSHDITVNDFIEDLKIFVSRILYPFVDFARINSKMNPNEIIRELENFEDILEIFLHLFYHSDDFKNSIDLKKYIMCEKLLTDINLPREKYIEITKGGVKRIQEIPPTILDKFFQATKSDNSNTRSSAVYALGYLEEPSAVDILCEILQNDDSFGVQKHAALALGRIKDQGVISLKPLIESLAHENSAVRVAAAEALGRLGHQEATDALIKSLKDKNADVRATSAESLGFIRNERAFIHLLESLDDENYRVISSVAISLGRYKDHRDRKSVV